MSTVNEIESAIAAHGAWKQKLRTAIETGQCESTPEKVKMDNNCSFGKWLHDRIDPKQKSSEFYNSAVDLHAKFHKEAGGILELALNGEKDEANSRMRLGGDFASYSAQLTKIMMSWKASLL